MKVLDGKVAIIVGGTSGIGARTAELFVEEGATVVIAGRRRDAGEALARKLASAASFVQTDVAREQELRELIEGTAARFGRIDCLFNNAGYGIPQRSIADLDIAEFDAQMAVIVRAVMLAMKFVAPALRLHPQHRQHRRASLRPELPDLLRCQGRSGACNPLRGRRTR